METIQDVLSSLFPQVEPLDYYRDLFALGYLDEAGAFTKGKFTGIAIQIRRDDADRKVLRHTICNDLNVIQELIKTDDFIVISPVSYVGRKQQQRAARELFAIVFDVDGLLTNADGRQTGLRTLIRAIDDKEIPKPTYIIASGNGIHVSYLLEQPLRLFPNVLQSLDQYRHALTNALWSTDISALSTKPQYESVTQGFRAVGSICKDGKTRVTAYKTGGKVSIDYLNSWLTDWPELLIDSGYKSKLSIDEAKELYPDWYERRVIQKQPKGTWTCNRALYDWWKEQVIHGKNRFRSKEIGATVGHRYFSIMALAVYARKCAIDRDELERDAMALLPILDAKTEDSQNRFTVDDVIDALEAYSAEYITFPRDVIQRITNIVIPQNKRNGRKQDVHLRIINAGNKIKREFGEQIGGSASKRIRIEFYLAKHPDTSIYQCAKDLQISTRTASKWLKELRKHGEV